MADRDGMRNGQQAPAHGVAPGAPPPPAGTAMLLWQPPPDYGHVLLLYLPVLEMYVREQQQRRRDPPRRHWLPRVRQLPGNDVTCIQAYRLDRGGVEEICQLLGPHLQPRVAAGRNIPVLQKVLMALHYLGTGGFQTDVAHRHATSQSSASRCLDAFLDAMLLHYAEFVTFPTEEADLRRAREGFYALAGFPNVIGAVDATHVGILAPSTAPGLYRNRHHQHSMNAQACCSAQGVIISVSALFPGSVHDAQAFDGSGLRLKVTAWPEGTGWLLGDRGYPLRPYLLTPYPVDVPGPQARYNVAHRRTRMVIEHCFGALKMRWRCLHLSGGRLMRTPATAGKTVVVCAMLHNLCVRRKTPLLDLGDGQGPMALPPMAQDPPRPPRQDPRGVAIRDRVAAEYFG